MSVKSSFFAVGSKVWVLGKGGVFRPATITELRGHAFYVNYEDGPADPANGFRGFVYEENLDVRD